MMDALGQAGSEYRWNYYSRGFSGEYTQIPLSELVAFLDLAQQYVEHSLRANKRKDQPVPCLQHPASRERIVPPSAGWMKCWKARLRFFHRDAIGVKVALASGKPAAKRLYRPDQHSYILYPDRDLPGFLEKNCLTPDQVNGLNLVSELVQGQR